MEQVRIFRISRTDEGDRWLKLEKQTNAWIARQKGGMRVFRVCEREDVDGSTLTVVYERTP